MVEEYITREAPDIEARRLGLLDSAKALAEQGITLPPYIQAQLTPEELKAIGLADTGIGAYQPYMDYAKQATQQGQALLGGITGAPTQAQLQQYMNPFQQQVIDATMAQLGEQGQLQQNQLAGQATRGGAFGGSRYGVQQAALSGEQQGARAQALAGLNLQNYGQAQQGFQNQMERERMAGLGIGALGSQYAQLGGQLQGMQQQDISQLLGIGGLQRQHTQQGYDSARQNIMQQLYEPYQRLGMYSDIFSRAPTSQQVIATGTNPSASPWQQGIGTGIGALAAYGGASRLGIV